MRPIHTKSDTVLSWPFNNIHVKCKANKIIDSWVTYRQKPVFRPDPRNIWVWTFSRVCLSQMNNAAGDSPLFTAHCPPTEIFVFCCVHHQHIHLLAVNPPKDLLYWGGGRSRESPEPLTQTFAFSHTAPLENVWRLSGVQCMSESR